ncbi:MAG: hypothetical protein KDI73_12250, partial [Candidatus Competibacteraceae bacterium]|nr:hypothetical protein [Candidatus Competibacteraceae bacterium]
MNPRFFSGALLSALLILLSVSSALGQAIVTTRNVTAQARTLPQTAAQISAALSTVPLTNPTILKTAIPNLSSAGVDYFGADDALIGDYGHNKIHHIQVSTASLVATIDLQSVGYTGRGAVVVAPDFRTAFLHEYNKLYVVRAPFDASAVSRTSVLTLPGKTNGGQFSSIDFDPAGRAFVNHHNGIAVLEPPYTSISFNIPVAYPAAGTNQSVIGNIVVTPDGSQLLTTDFSASSAGLYIFSAPFSAASRPVRLPTPCHALSHIALSPDGQTA